MRIMSFIIFFSIVIVLYVLVNIYIYQKGVFAIHGFPALNRYFTIVFWVLVLAYPIGRVFENIYLSYFSDFAIWIGSIWLAFMLYFFIICLLIDVLLLINRFLPYMPSLFFQGGFRLVLFVVIVAGVSTLITFGYFSAKNPVIKNVDVNISESAGERQELHAVLISDVHLGTLIGNNRLEHIVSEINNIGPEIIFIAGDLVDEDLEPVLRQDIGSTLNDFNAPLGVYAVTGNHEFIGGANDAVEYLEKHGITFVRDTVLKIDNSFYIIGREDKDITRFENKNRKPLEDLIGMIDHNYPVFLLDHQPFHLEKNANYGVDFQMSGHTHHGQMWPINYITSAIYGVSRGYAEINNMHVYVTSGVGTWGPPVRIGSKSEIINIKIYFSNGSED